MSTVDDEGGRVEGEAWSEELAVAIVTEVLDAYDAAIIVQAAAASIGHKTKHTAVLAACREVVSRARVTAGDAFACAALGVPTHVAASSQRTVLAVVRSAVATAWERADAVAALSGKPGCAGHEWLAEFGRMVEREDVTLAQLGVTQAAPADGASREVFGHLARMLGARVPADEPTDLRELRALATDARVIAPSLNEPEPWRALLAVAKAWTVSSPSRAVAPYVVFAHAVRLYGYGERALNKAVTIPEFPSYVRTCGVFVDRCAGRRWDEDHAKLSREAVRELGYDPKTIAAAVDRAGGRALAEARALAKAARETAKGTKH